MNSHSFNSISVSNTNKKSFLQSEAEIIILARKFTIPLQQPRVAGPPLVIVMNETKLEEVSGCC